VKKLIYLALLLTLFIVGCAEANDPVDSANSYLTEVVRVPTNGNAIALDVGTETIAVAEYDAGLSFIDKETFDRTWYHQLIAEDGSVIDLSRNRKIVVVEEHDLLFVTEEAESDNIRILNTAKEDTLTILPGILGGTYGIQQLEYEAYVDPAPGPFQDYIAMGSFCSGEALKIIPFDGLSQTMPGLLKEFLFPAKLAGYTITDEYVYAACGQRGIIISDYETTSILAEFDTPGEALSIVVNGDFAYITARQSGFLVYNISDLNNVTLVYEYDTTGYAKELSVTDSFVAVASGGGGLYLFNVADKNNIRFMERVTDIGYTNDVTIEDKRVYVGTRDEGLVVFDID